MKEIFSFSEAKDRIDMIDYLASLGYKWASHPRPNEYWFQSPFTSGGDSNPSFKVDRNRAGVQVWYDHSNGFGGDLIDFAKRFHDCGFGQILQKFRDFLSLSPAIEVNVRPVINKQKVDESEKDRKIIIQAERPIYQFYLKSYLRERAIPLALANEFLKEVDYMNCPEKNNSRIFTALGFKNDIGGYELRSRNFKASSAPKGVTLIQNISDFELQEKHKKQQTIAVIEGFFSFLSFFQLSFHNQIDLPVPDHFLVLNSASFFRKSFDLLDNYGEKFLYYRTIPLVRGH
ncbi:MAG TPA: hypothetical protein VL053_19895 [Arachidicoccus sp.]|nr:hypothetical protein [Arachidicoccus sp.]